MIASNAEIQTSPRLLGVEQLIAPLPKATFFSEYWNTKARYFPGEPDRFAALFNRADFDVAVHDCIDLKVGYTDTNGWPASFKITPDQIEELYAAGKTICASSVSQGDSKLQAFLKHWQADFAVVGNFFFNSYLSPDGAGFGLHIDTHSVWILQLEGKKHWRYSAAPEPRRVITNVSFPKDRKELRLPWGLIKRPDESQMEEVILSPGDALYLPKGTWHQAGAVGSSLALTLAEPYVTPLNLIQAILAKRIAHSVPLLDSLPALPTSEVESGLPPVLEEIFAEAIGTLRNELSHITPEELFGTWRSLL